MLVSIALMLWAVAFTGFVFLGVSLVIKFLFIAGVVILLIAGIIEATKYRL